MKTTPSNAPPDPALPPGRNEPATGRFKFRRVNEITGVFVLVVIAVLASAVVWTGHSQGWLKRRVNLQILLPEDGAAGIREGSEIYFLGTLVGSVSYVQVEATGRMEAETKIRRDFFQFVRVDSSAVVKKKFGVAGDSFFEITRGRGRPLMEKDASIVCTEQFQSALEFAIEEIHREALAVLKKSEAGLDTWTKLGADLGKTQQHLDQLSIRLEEMAAGIEAGKGTAGRLITDPALADQMQKLLARADETMEELQSVASNLDAAARNIKNGTTRLPEITGAVAEESKQLPGLVLQTKSSMVELERLVEALQHQWLVRKWVNPTNPAPLHPTPEPAWPETKSSKNIR